LCSEAEIENCSRSEFVLSAQVFGILRDFNIIWEGELLLRVLKKRGNNLFFIIIVVIYFLNVSRNEIFKE